MWCKANFTRSGIHKILDQNHDPQKVEAETLCEYFYSIPSVINSSGMKVRKNQTTRQIQNVTHCGTPVCQALMEELENMWQAGDCASIDAKKCLAILVGNPIHAFKIIRRMQSKWKEVETSLARGGLGGK